MLATTRNRNEWVTYLSPNFSNEPEEGERRFREALSSGQTGIADNPDLMVAFALLLGSIHRSTEAEEWLHRALTIKSNHIVARYNLGCLLQTEQRSHEAQAMFEQVLQDDPNHVDALINLAVVTRDLMRREDALRLMRRAAALEPDNFRPAYFELFESVYDPKTDDAVVYAHAKHAADLYCKNATSQIMALASPLLGRPLRVGFVSGDFKAHPVGHFLRGWLGEVDRSRLSLHAFSMFESQDAAAQQLRGQFDAWHVIAGLSDEAAKQLITNQQMDVLVDLAGHTDMNRLPLFASRAAPVQISWLGWYATTGVVNMDYFLTDSISSPNSSQAYHSEKLLYLPTTRLCMAKLDFAPNIHDLPALQNGYLTFGSFQALPKITDATLALWRRVLVRIPDTRMHIRCQQFSDARKLQDFETRCIKMGLPIEQIHFLPPVSYGPYFEAYHAIDFILDSVPFPGGTTTVEALWMGVPTLTLKGQTLIARQGASLLTAAGLDNWVASTEEEYLAKALYWSEHLLDLAALRAELRERVRTSPLFDAERFALAFTEAMEAATGS